MSTVSKCFRMRLSPRKDPSISQSWPSPYTDGHILLPYAYRSIAIGDAVVLGHTHTDAVASGVDHGLEVTGGVDPVVDSALSSICCASKYGEVVTEAIDRHLRRLYSPLERDARCSAGRSRLVLRSSGPH